MDSDSEIHRRTVRSFVLRQGRLTAGQTRAFATLWPRYGIEYHPEPLDLPTLFGNSGPVFLEIGFGNGDSLAEMARNHPERNYLGIEVHAPGVGHLLLKIEEYGLPNLRVMHHDAIDVLDNMLPPASLSGVYLFFADPWHKKRHHKRRIVQPDFIARLARLLRPNGFFHAATDWQDYAEHMLSVLDGASRLFRNAAGPGQFTPRPDDRPLTKFERRGTRLGHGVWDLIYTRLA